MGHVKTDSVYTSSLANRLGRGVSLALSTFAMCLLVSCSTISGWFSGSSTAKPASNEEVAGRLRPGDQISVRLDTGSFSPTTSQQSYDITIDENGEISLPLIGRIKAGGLTLSELAESIQAHYVPRYYVRCNATVLAAQRFFYISGEVRAPGRFLWSDDTTLLKAISTAGGFTDYANRGKVELIRGKDRVVYNCNELQQQPSKDPLIRPGDTILVRRSIF